MHRQLIVFVTVFLQMLLRMVSSACAADDPAARQVGKAAEAATAIPGQLIHPAGEILDCSGRLFDLQPAPDGSLVVLKSSDRITFVDSHSWKIRHELTFESGSGSAFGLAVISHPDHTQTIYASGSGKLLLEAQADARGNATWTRRIELPGKFLRGVAISPAGNFAYVCVSANNSVVVVDLASGKAVAEIPVSVCPYGIVLSPDGAAAWVTNFGGAKPVKGVATAKSVGTDVAVDQRGIPLSGTVSILDLKKRAAVGEIPVGLHPTQIISDPACNRLFVANANSDSVSIIDAIKNVVVETIAVRPDPGLPFGSIPNALALDPDARTLFCANGGNNAVAVISLDPSAQRSRLRGFIPAGWFPGSLACRGDALLIGNLKSGSLSHLPVPGDVELDRLTAQVRSDAQVPQVLKAMELAQGSADPVPVPQLGQPSVFHHVVFILKENKTYDQVFGDMPHGNNDPKLCVYPRGITPNHHALADQFVLLDNYYCNGVNSAEGHQWATQGITTDYQEKISRTYDFGTDALCYASCNFLWDSVLLHGLSVRNYGEFDFPTVTSKPHTWFDIYGGWDAGKVTFKQSVEVDALMHYTCREYPGWNLAIPDVCRAKVFLKDFAAFEAKGELPNFLLVYLPQDHTSGTNKTHPTPRAFVADNDLAMGQIVDAITHSSFWKDTCIVINEDDPQSGYDHVDGHRSLCLIASPYTRRGEVVSRFYNQTSALHTMAQIMGLPPMNQIVAQSPTMEDCFTDKPDYRPYTCLPNNIALDEPNKPEQAMSTEERNLLQRVEAMDFSRPDRINEDTFNRAIWLSTDMAAPYPAGFAGAHGRGLKALHLRLDGADDDD